MNRIVALTTLLMLKLASVAAAQSPLHLAVSDCGGAHLAAWACDSNTGTAVTVVGSIVIPDGVPLTVLTGQESRVRFDFLQAVPAWWRYGTGDCRPGSALQVDFTSALATCAVKMTDGGPLVGTRSYEVGPGGSDLHAPLLDRQARLVIGSAALASTEWAPAAGDEVALFTFSIGRKNSVGADACGGCTDCVIMALDRVLLIQPVGIGDHSFDSQGAGSSMVGGQGYFDECIVPANRTTWGQVKSLYR